MFRSVRKELRDVSPPLHGGTDYERCRREGIEPDDVLDFSVSTNPFAPCPAVVDAVAGAALGRYPDPSSGELRRALADMDGVPPERLLVTNGLSQAISLIAFALSDRGDAVLAATPTYGDYARASRLAGASVLEVPAVAEEDFAFPLKRLIDGTNGTSPALVWVCSPNNPTGTLPAFGDVMELAGACARRGSVLVLDEAYVNFAPPGASVLAARLPGALVMRSMTKDFGISGLRLGYVAGDASLIGRLAALQPSWSVNACAQAAGIAVVRNRTHYERQWSQIRSLAARLASDLRDAGYPPWPSAGNFLLVSVNAVGALRDFLWKRRILVRDCASFGLEGFIRVGVRSPEENERLVAALRDFRKEAV